MTTVEKSDGVKLVFARTLEDVRDYPLSDSFPVLACLVAAYLLFVLKIGPAFMKNREPYKLKNTILIYNALQVILSAAVVYYTSIPILEGGLVPKKCSEDDPVIRKSMLVSVVIYLFGKISELLDTVFFVLRKKYNQVSFLHVYHHSSVVMGTWMVYKYSLNMVAVYGGWINSLVHVVMYLYYFLAALGPQYQKYLTWKRYITTFQLVQFVSIFSHQMAVLLLSESCTHTVVGVSYVLFSTVLFFVLFYRFYKRTYNKKTISQAKTNGKNEAVKEKASNGLSDGKDKNDNTIVNGTKIKAN